MRRRLEDTRGHCSQLEDAVRTHIQVGNSRDLFGQSQAHSHPVGRLKAFFYCALWEKCFLDQLEFSFTITLCSPQDVSVQQGELCDLRLETRTLRSRLEDSGRVQEGLEAELQELRAELRQARMSLSRVSEN